MRRIFLLISLGASPEIILNIHAKIFQGFRMYFLLHQNLKKAIAYEFWTYSTVVAASLSTLCKAKHRDLNNP